MDVPRPGSSSPASLFPRSSSLPNLSSVKPKKQRAELFRKNAQGPKSSWWLIDKEGINTFQYLGGIGVFLMLGWSAYSIRNRKKLQSGQLLDRLGFCSVVGTQFFIIYILSKTAFYNLKCYEGEQRRNPFRAVGLAQRDSGTISSLRAQIGQIEENLERSRSEVQELRARALGGSIGSLYLADSQGNLGGKNG